MAVQTRTGRAPMSISVNKQAVYEAAEKLRNWGRWGRDDQIGTLNHVTPEDVVAAAGLIKRGQSFALGIPLDRNGPQTGLFGGRWNPIHTMLATGTDAAAGRQGKLLYADDAINMPVQAATHWDSLGHIFSMTRCTTATTRGWSIATGSASSASNTREPRWPDAGCCSTSRGRRASIISRTATASRTTSSTGPRRRRTWKSAAAIS